MARALSFLDRINSLPGVRAAFVPRVEGVPVVLDKGETLQRLEPAHRREVEQLGFSWRELWRAEQVHGAGLAFVPAVEQQDGIMPHVDGLLTSGEDGALLGIYVADCAAVYLCDRRTGGLGLVHSGRSGTEEEIVVRAIEGMVERFGTRPLDLEAAISPCIRPPHYEVDIAPQIEQQLHAAGVPQDQVTMSGVCTAANVSNYYSYRVEKGKTGRMLALLGRQAKTAKGS